MQFPDLIHGIVLRDLPTDRLRSGATLTPDGVLPRGCWCSPTGSELFGTGKWRIMPGFAVRYVLPELGSAAILSHRFRLDTTSLR
jgi:hypothetical protein